MILEIATWLIIWFYATLLLLILFIIAHVVFGCFCDDGSNNGSETGIEDDDFNG